MSALRWKIAQIFEQLWWKRYLSNKPKCEYLQWKQAYWQQFIQQIKNYIPDLFSAKKLHILDAGCGPAGVFTILQHHHVTAIDPLLSSYENNSYFNRNDYVEVNFTETTLEKFQAKENFDVVFCLNAINHVQDIQASVKNLHTSMKPNGYLVLSVDTHRNNFLKKIFQFIPGDILHPHQYSLNDYLKLLGRNNFKIETTLTLKQESIFNYEVIVAKKQL